MNRLIFAFIHVALPLILGGALYGTAVIAAPPTIVMHYIPDALWAYAFTSLLLLIWNGKIPVVWCSALLSGFVLFELAQAVKMIPGTGDILDAAVYALASLSAFAFYRFSLPRFWILIKGIHQ